MNDDRLNRYLADAADAITLAPADVTDIARRGRHRRNRRRVGLVGAVTAVALLGGAVAFRDASEAPIESAAAATVVPSDLDWTVLNPDAGLGYGRSTAVVDGVTYSLSTAPGPYQENSSYGVSLYRALGDGEWTEVALPDGMATSSLAAGDGALYAVGTAPASGGGRDLVVAASRDDAGSWSQVTLPADVAALEAAHPGRVVISQPSIASLDGSNVVAAVVVTANPDISMVDDAGGDISWEYTDTGVNVYDVADVENGATTSTMVRSAGDPDAIEGSYEEIGVPVKGDLAGSYTWAELGITPDLEPYLHGRTFVYASDDGQTFEPVEIPAQGWGAQLVAADDGYRLFVSQSGEPQGTVVPDGTTTVLSSIDGRVWNQSEVLSGSGSDAGLLGGRPAISTYTANGRGLFVERAQGAWAPLDLSAVLPDGGSVADVAFGPMGMVATAFADGGGELRVVHSSDGTTVSVVELGDLVDLSDKAVVGLSVSADAITVRLSVIDDNEGDVPAQVVVVGTPR